MAWIKVESSVARNRKFVKAGPGPSWLWLCGLAYSQDGLTDGFIPDEAVGFLGVKSARSMIKHLVSAGLWDVVDGGWQIHDYLAHNRSALDIEAIRQARADGGKLGGRPNLHGNLQGKPSNGAEVNLTGNPSTATATATETDQKEISAEPPRDSTPPVLIFPVVGTEGGAWGLTRSRVDGWVAQYPNLDVSGECQRALAWLEANPSRRKTAKGMPAFLVNWLNRAVDRPRGAAAPSAVNRMPEWARKAKGLS